MTKELTRDLRILNEHHPILQQKYHVKKIGIFGSVSRGTQRRGSDIDILVEFSQPIGFFSFLDLETHLGRLLKKRVDLVTKQSLKPLLRKPILNDVVYA